MALVYPFDDPDSVVVVPAITLFLFLVPGGISITIIVQAVKRGKALQSLLIRARKVSHLIDILDQKAQSEEFSVATKSAFFGGIILSGGVLMVRYDVPQVILPIVGLSAVVSLLSFVRKPQTTITLCTSCKNPLPDVTQYCPHCGLLHRQPPAWYLNYTILSLYSILLAIRLTAPLQFNGSDQSDVAIALLIIAIPGLSITLLYHWAINRPLKPKGLLVAIKFMCTVIGGGLALLGVIFGGYSGLATPAFCLLALVLLVLGLVQDNT